MTRKRRSPKAAEQIKMQLVEIIKDTFDNNGQVITHGQLADEHVRRNASRNAEGDVHLYGGPAVVYLRRNEHYAIVPVTASVATWDGDPEDEVAVANTVAGLGAGGSRIGWYLPASKDDWLWIYYNGHLSGSGQAAVFWAGKVVDDNPQLISAKGRTRIAGRAIARLPIPPGKTEVKVLSARLGE